MSKLHDTFAILSMAYEVLDKAAEQIVILGIRQNNLPKDVHIPEGPLSESTLNAFAPYLPEPYATTRAEYMRASQYVLGLGISLVENVPNIYASRTKYNETPYSLFSHPFDVLELPVNPQQDAEGKARRLSFLQDPGKGVAHIVHALQKAIDQMESANAEVPLSRAQNPAGPYLATLLRGEPQLMTYRDLPSIAANMPSLLKQTVQEIGKLR